MYNFTLTDIFNGMLLLILLFYKKKMDILKFVKFFVIYCKLFIIYIELV